MRVVFMGTPRFAAEVLDLVCTQHDVVGVFTRADAVSGRGKKLIPSPVKQVAEERGIPVYTPMSFNDEEVVNTLRMLAPEVICVAAYGMILPPSVLAVPPHGCLNVHASLLPRWRGAAPIQRAMLEGDEQVGVCIMRMEEGLDTGDYCICRSTDVAQKNFTVLTEESADLGAQALLTALQMLEAGTLEWTVQDSALATYAEKIGKGELFIDPSMPVDTVVKHVRASSPAHPARCVVASRAVTVLEVAAVPHEVLMEQLDNLPKGRILLRGKKLYLGCFDGAVEVLVIRPDGKKTMEALAFAAGVQNVKSGLITWEGQAD